MTVNNEKQLSKLLRIGKICGTTLKMMQEAVKPGITTAELNDIGARYLHQQGARPAPILTYNFPGATCISINDEAAHGIPGDRVIQPGDLVNVDVSAELDGYFADCGGSVAVPPVRTEDQQLCDYTLAALDAAINVVSANRPLYVIGQAVESVARKGGYNVIRELSGHGVGRSLHEEPRHVPNFFSKRAKQPLTEGMVLTLEPFLTRGVGKVVTADDGWTLKTINGTRACQYEHTVMITRGKPLLVTAV